MSNPTSTARGSSNWRRRLLLGALWLGIAAGAYFGGRSSRLPQATAEPPSTSSRAATTPTAASSALPSDYSRRPVAFICNNTIPITREDLGEYLIARYGKEKLKHLINKRIIEHAAAQKGIEVTAAEVNAAVAADAAQFGADATAFEKNVLKKYNKTLYEWKEDVVRPRLMMEKMCRSRVTVTGEDLAKAYEAHYGEKVDCKIIIWPRQEERIVMNQIWPKIRNDDKEFDRAARSQISPSLAAAGGHVKPIGRYTTGDEALEKVLFSLNPGEVSEVLDKPEGLVVVKCLGRVKADASKTLDQARPELSKEVFERKVAMEIGVVFRELQKAAAPNNLMEPRNEIIENVQHELDPLKSEKSTTPASVPMSTQTPGTLPDLPLPDGK